MQSTCPAGRRNQTLQYFVRFSCCLQTKSVQNISKIFLRLCLSKICKIFLENTLKCIKFISFLGNQTTMQIFGRCFYNEIRLKYELIILLSSCRPSCLPPFFIVYLHRRFSLIYHLPDPYKNCSSLTADV